MTDEIDTHGKFIRACQDYLRYNERFENKGSDEAAINARVALGEVKRLSSIRREEIQVVRKERRKLRNGKNGRPKNITIEAY